VKINAGRDIYFTHSKLSLLSHRKTVKTFVITIMRKAQRKAKLTQKLEFLLHSGNFSLNEYAIKLKIQNSSL